MINDLESNIMSSDNTENNSDKFVIKSCDLQSTFQNLNIISMSTSKKNIYLFTDHAELYCIDSHTLKPIKQAYSIRSSDTPSNIQYKEHFTRIWTDREGNHSIIRFCGKIYYFNCLGNDIKELNIFKGIEIMAVGFDDSNVDPNNTGRFLAADYNNNIYECNISFIKKGSDYIIKDSKNEVSKLNLIDWDTEEDDEFVETKKEKIFGIKMVKTTKKEVKPGENYYYIIIVTRTRIYQFSGPGDSTFKQTFERYNESPILFNDSCKYFPSLNYKKNLFVTDLDILYKNDRINQFGWKTDSGYCFGTFEFAYLPEDLKKFTVIPFAKITSSGCKETNLEPISVTHTLNHLYILYKDCLTIMSKLTSNIINTIYFQTDYRGLIYNEFSENGGHILLYSNSGLYQISLKDENKDIWQDYLDTGDYESAQRLCKNEKLSKRIQRINAEESFNKKDYENSAIKYYISDEKFEIVCLKYLMKNELLPLYHYLEYYSTNNVNMERECNAEINIIITMLIELLINRKQSDKKKDLNEFRQIVRDKCKYLMKGNVIKELLQSYGKMEEFVEFTSIMGDYESAILYYINEGKIDLALQQLTNFSSFADKNSLKILSDIFQNNCHIFFKNNPKESINFVEQLFKDIEMKYIIQAIISTTDKDSNSISMELTNNSNIQSSQEENSIAIMSYLKRLVKKPKIEEERNIHNLYIYYLSRNKANQEAILEYLKGPLKSDKKEVLFQLDYAKKLFKDNIPAYALVLALTGKYSEGVKTALNAKNEECLKIAKFIASNAPGEKLKKKLWIDIFSCDSQSEFQEALKIMKESKILKIEDVLPHITDTIKIEEFKKQISNCINDYEGTIKKLKEDITEYNQTAENIKNDIIKVKKKSMEINYSSCKCDICQGYIKDKNIFLFPCGHMFDANCIKQCLLDYEATGLEYIHDKNVEIDNLFYELGMSKEKSFIQYDQNQVINKEPEEKKQQEEQGMSFVFNRFKINIDLPVFKRQEVVEGKSNVVSKTSLVRLNEILSEQCVLCGDYMVDSIQYSICRPERMEVIKGSKMKTQKQSNWEFIK